MTVPGLQMTWWRILPLGGIEQVGDGDATATMACLKLPTLPESTTFHLPVDRELLDGFLLGLNHGVAIGRADKGNEMRRMLGFETALLPPVMKGVGNASRKL